MTNFEIRLIGDLLAELKAVLELRKEHVPFDHAFHQGQVKVGAERQGLFINLSASADKHLSRFPDEVNLARSSVDLVLARQKETAGEYQTLMHFGRQN